MLQKTEQAVWLQEFTSKFFPPRKLSLWFFYSILSILHFEKPRNQQIFKEMNNQRQTNLTEGWHNQLRAQAPVSDNDEFELPDLDDSDDDQGRLSFIVLIVVLKAALQYILQFDSVKFEYLHSI